MTATQRSESNEASSLKTKQPIGVGVCEVEVVVSGGTEIEGAAVVGGNLPI